MYGDLIVFIVQFWKSLRSYELNASFSNVTEACFVKPNPSNGREGNMNTVLPYSTYAMCRNRFRFFIFTTRSALGMAEAPKT